MGVNAYVRGGGGVGGGSVPHHHERSSGSQRIGDGGLLSDRLHLKDGPLPQYNSPTAFVLDNRRRVAGTHATHWHSLANVITTGAAPHGYAKSRFIERVGGTMYTNWIPTKGFGNCPGPTGCNELGDVSDGGLVYPGEMDRRKLASSLIGL